MVTDYAKLVGDSEHDVNACISSMIRHPGTLDHCLAGLLTSWTGHEECV